MGRAYPVAGRSFASGPPRQEKGPGGEIPRPWAVFQGPPLPRRRPFIPLRAAPPAAALLTLGLALRRLHAPSQARHLALGLGQPDLVLTQRLGGPVHVLTQAPLALRGLAQLLAQALELPLSLRDVAPLRHGAIASSCGGIGRRAERGRRLLALEPSSHDAIAKAGIAGSRLQGLGDELENSGTDRVAGASREAGGGLDDGGIRLPLLGRGGAPFGDGLVVSLERASLRLLEPPRRVGELLERLGGRERRAVDQPSGDAGAPQLLDAIGLGAVAGSADLLRQLVATGDESVGMLPVELVEALLS